MRKLIVAPLLIAALISSVVVSAQKSGFLSGAKIELDEKSGHTVVTDARIKGEEGFFISAGRASFTIDENETPRSMELTDLVQFQVGASRGLADRAVYYPELQLLSAAQITFFAEQSRNSLMSPSLGVSYTCSSGILYANGRSTGGSSTCSNLSSGGSVSISCGGSGGNEVQMIRLRNACIGGG